VTRHVVAAIVGAAVVTGCSVHRIDNDVYHSPKGYRVMIPGPDWDVVRDSQADLHLQHRSGAAGIVTHASCDRAASRRTPAGLERQLLAGLRDRHMVEHGPALVDGRVATHTVLDARGGAGDAPLRIEVYTLVGDGCVWDLVYAAARGAFPTWRADFDRLVASFTIE
jgi:hypothetical protein